MEDSLFGSISKLEFTDNQTDAFSEFNLNEIKKDDQNVEFIIFNDDITSEQTSSVVSPISVSPVTSDESGQEVLDFSSVPSTFDFSSLTAESSNNVDQQKELKKHFVLPTDTINPNDIHFSLNDESSIKKEQQQTNLKESKLIFSEPKRKPKASDPKKRKRKNSKKPKNKQKTKAESTTRKKKKIRKKLPVMKTAVSLDRETLLSISSEEFDKWVAEIKSKRVLTQEEIKDIRNQKRKIKNRESAQASRDRKKKQFTELKETVSKLNNEKQEMMNEILKMKAQIQNLKTENNFLKTTIQQNGLLKNMYNSFSSGINSVSSSLPIQFGSNSQKEKSNFTQKAKTAGVCLFILLFSFGLFFNLNSSLIAKDSPLGIKYQRPVIPSASLSQKPTSTSSTLKPCLTNKGRKLLWDKKKKQRKVNLVSSETVKNDDNKMHVSPSSLTVSAIKLEHDKSANKQNGNNNNNKDSNSTISFANNDSPTDHSIEHSTNYQILEPDVFLYCLKAHELSSAKKYDPDNFIMDIMIPRSALSSDSKILKHVNSQDNMINVKCKILPQLKIPKLSKTHFEIH